MSVESIFETITRHASEVIPSLADHHFVMTDSLRELGANSIDRSEIIMMTLESLNANVPLIEMAGAENIGELASVIHEKL